MPTKNQSKKVKEDYTKRSQNLNLLSGFLFGVSLVAFLDETVFHQILHWHHFYDKSTTNLGLISDGLFHAFSWLAAIGGLFMYAHLQRQYALFLSRWWGGVLLGAGGFQLYDGIIQHKLLRIHQIRYVENVFPYDLTWNLIAIALLITGLVLIIRTQQNPDEAKSREHL